MYPMSRSKIKLNWKTFRMSHQVCFNKLKESLGQWEATQKQARSGFAQYFCL